MSNTRRVQGKGRTTNGKGSTTGLRWLVALMIASFAATLLFPAVASADELTISGEFLHRTGMFLDHPTQSQGVLPLGVVTSSDLALPDESDGFSTFRNVLDLEFNWQGGEGVWSAFVKVQGVRELDHYGISENLGTDNMPNVNQGFYTGVDLRDAFVTYRASDNWTLNVGRQIVTWGEAFSARINDVINPQDLTFAFGFESLEQTRLPITMVRSVHTNFTPLDLYAEFIWAPGIDPAMMHSDHNDGRYDGQTDVAGRINNLAPPGSRFSPVLGTDPLAGLLVPGPATQPVSAVGAASNWAIPDPSDGMQYGMRLLKRFGRWQTGFLVWHSHQYNPVFDASLNATRQSPAFGCVPGGQISPGDPRCSGASGVATSGIVFPEETSYGLSLSGALSPDWTFGLPMVLRTELNYTPDKTMNDVFGSIPGHRPLANVTTIPDAATPGSNNPVIFPVAGKSEHDETKYMIGLDLSQYPLTFIDRSAQLNMTFEHWGTIVEDNGSVSNPGFTDNIDHVSRSYLLTAATSFDYGTYGVSLPILYEEGPQNFTWFPSVSYNPPWTANMSFSLQWIGFSIDERPSEYGSGQGGIGLFHDKDMVVFKFNYSLPSSSRTF